MSGRTSVVAFGLVAAFGLALAACKGEQGSAPTPGGGASAGASAGSASAASSNAGASASAAASAKGGDSAAPATFTGAFEAKAATVYTPETAPPFENEPAGALGSGTLTLVLAGDGGEVTGEASGAFGALKLHGLLEGTRLTAQATPDPAATPAMWGTLLADVEGSGDARKVTGTLRASSADGHIVREAAFTLTKK